MELLGLNTIQGHYSYILEGWGQDFLCNKVGNLKHKVTPTVTNYYPTFYYNDPRYVTCNGTYCNSISLMLNVNQMYPSSFSLYIKVIGMGRTTDFCVIGKKEDFTWYLAAGREQDTVGNEKNSEGSKNTEHFWKVWRYDETDTKHTSTTFPHRS